MRKFVEETVTQFERDLRAITTASAAVIARFAAQATTLDDADERLDASIDELKGYLGTAAANRGSDRVAEAAITEVEGWVSENVANAPIETRIAAVIYMAGSDAERQLTEIFAPAPAPATP